MYDYLIVGAGLFGSVFAHEAARAGKKALSLLTVSDVTATGEKLSAHERQVSFNDMIELALKVAVE